MDTLKNLKAAVELASERCQGWFSAENGDYFSPDLLLFTARTLENDPEMGADTLYLVSAEGALGIATKWEYMVQWLFIPVKENPERLISAAGAMEREKEREAAEKQPEDVKRFCRNCGQPLKPGQAFCTNCGTRLN